jgi:hypothetical protein
MQNWLYNLARTWPELPEPMTERNIRTPSGSSQTPLEIYHWQTDPCQSPRLAKLWHSAIVQPIGIESGTLGRVLPEFATKTSSSCPVAMKIGICQSKLAVASQFKVYMQKSRQMSQQAEGTPFLSIIISAIFLTYWILHSAAFWCWWCGLHWAPTIENICRISSIACPHCAWVLLLNNPFGAPFW